MYQTKHFKFVATVIQHCSDKQKGKQKIEKIGYGRSQNNLKGDWTCVVVQECLGHQSCKRRWLESHICHPDDILFGKSCTTTSLFKMASVVVVTHEVHYYYMKYNDMKMIECGRLPESSHKVIWFCCQYKTICSFVSQVCTGFLSIQEIFFIYRHCTEKLIK